MPALPTATSATALARNRGECVDAGCAYRADTADCGHSLSVNDGLPGYDQTGEEGNRRVRWIGRNSLRAGAVRL